MKHGQRYNLYANIWAQGSVLIRKGLSASACIAQINSYTNPGKVISFIMEVVN